MTAAVDGEVAELTGAAALPRRNGELVFEAPWESRAFAAAVALADQDRYEWETFRQALIAEIGSWESGQADAEWSYYERWLAALEAVLTSSGILAASEIDAATALAAEQLAHEHDH